MNGAQRDTDTVDPFTVAETVLAINPACPIVMPGDIVRIEVPPLIPRPIPGPPPEVLGAAVGGLAGVGPRLDVDLDLSGVRRSLLRATADGRSFPIAFDFPWDPRVTGCIGLVYRRGTTTLVSVTSGSLTIGRCGWPCRSRTKRPGSRRKSCSSTTAAKCCSSRRTSACPADPIPPSPAIGRRCKSYRRPVEIALPTNGRLW